jgi:hypothetical protein
VEATENSVAGEEVGQMVSACSGLGGAFVPAPLLHAGKPILWLPKVVIVLFGGDKLQWIELFWRGAQAGSG